MSIGIAETRIADRVKTPRATQYPDPQPSLLPDPARDEDRGGRDSGNYRAFRVFSVVCSVRLDSFEGCREASFVTFLLSSYCSAAYWLTSPLFVVPLSRATAAKPSSRSCLILTVIVRRLRCSIGSFGLAVSIPPTSPIKSLTLLSGVIPQNRFLGSIRPPGGSATENGEPSRRSRCWRAPSSAF